MRILFALPGLHRYDRGAEIAFISVARELAKSGEVGDAYWFWSNERGGAVSVPARGQLCERKLRVVSKYPVPEK